jgi:hypothetical protein
MTAYFRFVLGHRLAILIACAIVTLAALAVMTRASMSSSLVEMILGEHPAYLRYAERVKHFGSDEQVVIGFEADLGDAAVVGRLENIVERLAAHGDVARVTSPLDLRGGDLTAKLDPAKLATHPISGGLLRAARAQWLLEHPHGRGAAAGRDDRGPARRPAAAARLDRGGCDQVPAGGFPGDRRGLDLGDADRIRAGPGRRAGNTAAAAGHSTGDRRRLGPVADRR